MILEYFRATRNSPRFRENQKVWIKGNQANHLYIRFKYRGNGRYVGGVVDKHIKLVGEIKSIEVDEVFAKRILGDWFDDEKFDQEKKKLKP